MAQVTHFFAGANSGNGFQNLFPQIVNPENAFDFMILKGGPGVGKNTFMREIGQTMEKAGADVEYLWCSGDPDSLDGVVLPQIRCAVADGTSPHVLEPRYPAGVDRYVNLGRFYDIIAAKYDAESIKTHTKAYQAAYTRAYSALKAARQIECDAALSVSCETDRIRERLFSILRREMRAHRDATKKHSGKGKLHGNAPDARTAKATVTRTAKAPNAHTGKVPDAHTGKTVKRFLGSITHRGYVWRFDSVETLCPHVCAISDRFGFMGTVFAELHETVTRNGWNSIVCMAPEEPSRVEHLLIPELELAFISTRPGMEYEPGNVQTFRRIRFDTLTRTDNKSLLRLETRITTLLREHAVSELRQAKACHDELEAVYNPYVDFDGVRALAAQESGRLLSIWEHYNS